MIFAFDNIIRKRPNLAYGWIISCVLFIVSSCGIKKYIPEDRLLLVKNHLEVERPYKKEIKKQLSKYYKQTPNRKFLLVFKARPYFYVKGTQGKDNWFKRFERESLGEQPVIIDTVYIEGTVKSINSYLRSKGYYYADITYKVEETHPKKGEVTYHVRQNARYFFGDVTLQVADRNVYKLVKDNMKESFIHKGYGLDQGNLLLEQDRIITLLRNNGYYMMSKEYIDFDADTAGSNFYVPIGINIRNPSDHEVHKKYYNDDVIVEITPNQTTQLNGNRVDSFQAKNFTYYPNRFPLNPNVLDKNILIERDKEFKQVTLNRTYARMSDLGIFRFVNVQTSPYTRNDSGFLSYHIRLIPTVKYDFTFEPQLTTSDQNNTITAGQDFRNYGVAFVTQFFDRNIFHSAEVLKLSLRSAFEAQGSVKNSGLFNSTEQRLTASVTIPRTLFYPLADRNERFLSTKTIFTTSGTYELNVDYQRQVFTTGIAYQFNKPLISYYFTPLEFSYIKSSIVSQELKKQSESDVFLQNLFSNNVILNTKFGFAYSNKPVAKGINSFYLKWDVIEIGDNPLYYIGHRPKDDNGNSTILGVRYFQYAKTAADIRFNTDYDQNNKTAYRIYAGYGLPYGNASDFLPFEKRFFVGGANDLRGWVPRSVGPGSYTTVNQLDFSGEIKLMVNGEYRFNIYNRWLEGAVFADAGNIWIAKKNITRPNADFQLNRFYKEFAVDAGFGTRLNFEIFIIRFDFAVPLHDPSYTEGNRWVVKDFNGSWLFKNINFNFGIGYPF